MIIANSSCLIILDDKLKNLDLLNTTADFFCHSRENGNPVISTGSGFLLPQE